MKNFFILIIALISINTLKAQDSTSYSKSLKALLLDAQNNFAENKTVLTYYDTAKQIKYYQPKTDFKATKSFIQQNLDDNSMVALYYFDWNDIEMFTSSSKLLSPALDILNLLNSSGNFKGKDYNNQDGSTTTELKDSDGNYIMELTTSNKDKFMKLLLYSKSWGKR